MSGIYAGGYRRRVKHPYTIFTFEDFHTILINAHHFNSLATCDLLLQGLQFHGVIVSQYTVYAYCV